MGDYWSPREKRKKRVGRRKATDVKRSPLQAVGFDCDQGKAGSRHKRCPGPLWGRTQIRKRVWYRQFSCSFSADSDLRSRASRFSSQRASRRGAQRAPTSSRRVRLLPLPSTNHGAISRPSARRFGRATTARFFQSSRCSWSPSRQHTPRSTPNVSCSPRNAGRGCCR